MTCCKAQCAGCAAAGNNNGINYWPRFVEGTGSTTTTVESMDLGQAGIMAIGIHSDDPGIAKHRRALWIVNTSTWNPILKYDIPNTKLDVPVYVYYTYTKQFVLAVADIQPDPSNGVHYWSFAFFTQGGIHGNIAVVDRPWGKLNQDSVTISND